MICGKKRKEDEGREEGGEKGRKGGRKCIML